MTKTALKVVHRNDRAQIKRLLTGSGQALLPMPELLEGAQASIDELMHGTAVALVEQMLVSSLKPPSRAPHRGSRFETAVMGPIAPSHTKPGAMQLLDQKDTGGPVHAPVNGRARASASEASHQPSQALRPGRRRQKFSSPLHFA